MDTLVPIYRTQSELETELQPIIYNTAPDYEVVDIANNTTMNDDQIQPSNIHDILIRIFLGFIIVLFIGSTIFYIVAKVKERH
ncbi:MAG TPA: hypothetical protein VLG50_05675 [Candidatus Saccharimonadales bacterium]|nr:hypothetical protein [Candidatus Saccharimonadales bacterium]